MRDDGNVVSGGKRDHTARFSQTTNPRDIRLQHISAFLFEQDAVAVAGVFVLAGSKHNEMTDFGAHFRVAFVVVGRQALFQPFDALGNFAVDAAGKFDGVWYLFAPFN